VSDKNAKIADLEDQLGKMRVILTSTKAELAQLKETPPAPSPMDFSKGVIFKVQIGAFKNKIWPSILTITRTLVGRQQKKVSSDLPSACFAIIGGRQV